MRTIVCLVYQVMKMPIDLHDSTPLYLQIVNDIKSKIAANKLKADDQLGSHADLASSYGVSIITVKKALATMIYEGIIFSRVGKGTYVAKPAPEKHRREQRTIGLVLRDIRSPFFSRTMHAVEDAAYELGYHVLISNSSGKVEKEEAQIARFRKFGVNGMIIATMTHKYHATPTIRRLLHEEFPFVMVSYIADDTIPLVACDHALGGFMATDYLLKMGYQKVGYINGEEGNMVGELRFQGYERALKAHGRRTDNRALFRLSKRGEWHDYQSGYQIGKQFRRLSVKPDAMFVYNDLSALGFEHALLEQGIRVPQDVAIVGFDDIERGQYAAVPLTTVRQPTDLIGHQAMELLVNQMQGKNGSIRRILKPELVIRESCGAAVRNPSSRKAARTNGSRGRSLSKSRASAKL